MLDRLNEPMVQFIGRREMVWIATADAHGEGRDWGTDDARAKGGDYFGTACRARPAAPG